MAINITDIQDKLYEWVDTETGVTTIWANPDAPRPPLPYFTLFMNSLLTIGVDYVARPTSGSSGAKIWGNREFTLTVNHYGNGSLQALENLKSSLAKPTVWELLDEESIAFVDRLAINHLPELIDSRYEDRAIMDLLFRVPSEIVDANVGIIEKVAVEKTFKDPAQQTIIVENIEIP